MNTEHQNNQLHFLDITGREYKYNAVVIGKVGRGAAFHLIKTFYESLNIPYNLCISGKTSEGCRKLQLFLPAPNNQTNLFPRVLTFQEKMLRFLNFIIETKKSR